MKAYICGKDELERIQNHFNYHMDVFNDIRNTLLEMDESARNEELETAYLMLMSETIVLDECAFIMSVLGDDSYKEAFEKSAAGCFTTGLGQREAETEEAPDEHEESLV